MFGSPRLLSITTRRPPAIAYRFDTTHCSVVVSGDTTVSQNLIDLAQGCDYFVHEVIDARFVDALVAALPPEAADRQLAQSG